LSLTDTVTSPSIPGTVPQLHTHVARLKRLANERDSEMMIISMVRKGKPELLFPDLFNDTWKRQIVANWIDGFAREFAEMIAPLPALNCSSKGMRNRADKKQASEKNLVGTHYWRESRLDFFMLSHADRYLTYGFAPFVIEPDYESRMPRIRCEDSIGAYYENDRYGKTLRYAKCWYQTAGELAAQFPEYRSQILSDVDTFGQRQAAAADTRLEVVRYCDAGGTWLYLPGRANMVLAFYANPLDRCPVYVAERPGLYDQPSGQFRDVVWVQLARHRMALLGLEIGVKSASAPIAVPRDVVEMAVGPDAVIQTDSPEKIRRVGIEVPASVFQLEGQLKEELLMGSRYPEGRASGIDASVITGKGVQALMGSFDSQISTAQTVLGRALSEATSMCFEMDEKVWPSKKKRIYGQTSGEPYDLTYIPSALIDGDYTCEVSYGFAAGLAPNNAIVMMLQLRGDGLIDRDTVRRNLPFSINVDQMQRQMDIEQTNDAMKQGLFALLQSLGPMAAQGGDPMPYLNATAAIIKGRQDGKPLEDLFIKAFAPETLHPAPPEDPNAPPADPNAPPADPAAAAGADPGQPLPQPGAAPGGPMPLQMLVAGMRNGNPNLQAAVSRRLPATG
jgi:hypothetical protein